MEEFTDFLPCGSTVLEDYRVWQVSGRNGMKAGKK